MKKIKKHKFFKRKLSFWRSPENRDDEESHKKVDLSYREILRSLRSLKDDNY